MYYRALCTINNLVIIQEVKEFIKTGVLPHIAAVLIMAGLQQQEEVIKLDLDRQIAAGIAAVGVVDKAEVEAAKEEGWSSNSWTYPNSSTRP